MALPPMVAPFCRDDCALVSDGAGAVVVMSAERAKQLKVKKPVPILGFGHGQTSWEVAQRPDMTSTRAKVAAETAFRMAGLKPKDMDVAASAPTPTPSPRRRRIAAWPSAALSRRLRQGIEDRLALPATCWAGSPSDTGRPA